MIYHQVNIYLWAYKDINVQKVNHTFSTSIYHYQSPTTHMPGSKQAHLTFQHRPADHVNSHTSHYPFTPRTKWYRFYSIPENLSPFRDSVPSHGPLQSERLYTPHCSSPTSHTYTSPKPHLFEPRSFPSCQSTAYIKNTGNSTFRCRLTCTAQLDNSSITSPVISDYETRPSWVLAFLSSFCVPKRLRAVWVVLASMIRA